ncbi:PilT/PilU family type 4a pilus ATPase [Salinisphaera hydrothermalis]|uniref:Pilus retraction protein PilT n=1 Tax=Salinisphaera hydrothermalis (strain C41B8) TaxID=1304275 RepID=A0A084ILF1_SALHC|nr:PilT/PilU family type 4a pilus ATPase [Salinisphaera hydrothermalis]KEZ77535.1 pilus retraction protein PilT [Salinisphaera hydrothermalis C41B8]
MDRAQATKLVTVLLERLIADGGSDLFITAGFAPAIKKDGQLTPLMERPLTDEQSALMVRSIMNDRQAREFDEFKEAQFAISPSSGRFRVSAFVQQGRVGAVLRVINTEIPEFDDLGLPPILKDVVMAERGLVIFVGATGSGKSTSLAAMLGHRNANQAGHIITIEDPIEFVHPHRKSIVTQREVGVDTQSWDNALKNTLRQAPNVILVGEVRSRETMEYALNFAETGHLVLCTLHANNANQALDRVINFFDEAKREQVLMDLSLNMRAIISQRLVRRVGGGRAAAVEILLNTPLVTDLVFKGKVAELRDVMARGTEQGMQTFDQHLFQLFEDGVIDFAEALRNADSQNELRLNIKLNSERARQNLSMDPEVRSLTMADHEDDRDDQDDGHG